MGSFITQGRKWNEILRNWMISLLICLCRIFPALILFFLSTRPGFQITNLVLVNREGGQILKVLLQLNFYIHTLFEGKHFLTQIFLDPTSFSIQNYFGAIFIWTKSKFQPNTLQTEILDPLYFSHSYVYSKPNFWTLILLSFDRNGNAESTLQVFKMKSVSLA